MGSNLGLAMRAANAFFQEQDAQKIRDQQQKQWDFNNKKEEAGLSTLADRTEADRARARMNAAQDSAAMTTIPFKTQADQGYYNAIIKDQQFAESQRSGLESFVRNRNQGALDRQPAELETFATNAQTALSNAKVNQADAQVAEGGIGQRVTAGRQKQATDDYAQHAQTVATLAQAIDSGDSASAIKLINGLNEALPEGQRVKPAVKIGTINNGTQIIALDAEGNPTGAPMEVSKMRQLANQGQSVKLKPGETIGTYSKSGFTPAYTAPDPTGSIAKQGPLQRDVEYLVKNHGMTNEQALAHLSAAKTMTKQQFVLQAIKEKAAKGFEPPTQKDAEDFGALYDSVNGVSQTNAPAAQPTAVGKSGVNYRDFLK